MMPSRFPVTLVDFVAYSLRMGSGNFVLKLSGRIDETRLRKAIRLMMDAEPILGCQFVNHWFRPYWRRREDLDELPLCHVVQGEEDGPEFVRYHIASLDPARDPLLDITIFRAETDTICLKACHAVLDGPAATQLFPALMSTYRRLRQEPDFVPTPNVAGTRHRSDLGLKYSFRQKLQVVRQMVAGPRIPVATWLFPECRGEDAFHGYVMLRLPPARVRALARYGRDRQATMTSVMLTGLYLAALEVFRVASDEVATFTTTVDLRHFLPLARRNYTVANMSGPGRFRMPPRRIADFEQALASIRDQLKRILKDPTCLPSSLAFLFAFPFLQRGLESLPFSLLGRLINGHYAREISRPERRWGGINVGRIDPQLLAFEGASVEDAYGTGPLVMGGGMAAVFTIFRDTLTLSLGLSGRVMDEDVARRFLGQVDLELPFHAEAPGRVLTQEVRPDVSRLSSENG